MPSTSIYYVYIYVDPTDGQPFYVGKGKGNRYKQHLRLRSYDKNELKKNKIKKILDSGKEPIIQFYAKDLLDEESIIIERQLISKYGRRNNNTGILTNMTDGGEGTSGNVSYLRTDDHKQNLSNSRKESKWYYHPEKEIEITLKHDDIIPPGYIKGRITVTVAGENNPWYGKNRSGNLNPMFGVSHTEESRKKISEAAIRIVECPNCNKEMGAKKLSYHIKKCL